MLNDLHRYINHDSAVTPLNHLQANAFGAPFLRLSFLVSTICFAEQTSRNFSSWLIIFRHAETRYIDPGVCRLEPIKDDEL